MPLWQMSVVIQQELVAQMPGGVAVAGRSTLGQRSWTSAHGRVFMDERSWIGVQAFAHLLSEARRKRQQPCSTSAVEITVSNWFAPCLAIPRAQGEAHELT